MANDQRHTGADIPIQITIKDEDGAVVDISGFTAVAAFVYYADDREVLAKFNTLEPAGYEPIEIIDGPNGVIEIKLQSDVTAGARDGELYLEVKTQATDADYDDSIFHSVARDIPLFHMTRSISSGNTDLAS